MKRTFSFRRMRDLVEFVNNCPDAYADWHELDIKHVLILIFPDDETFGDPTEDL